MTDRNPPPVGHRHEFTGPGMFCELPIQGERCGFTRAAPWHVGQATVPAPFAGFPRFQWPRRTWHQRVRRWFDRMDPRREFCFACDRFTVREHKRHAAFVALASLPWHEEPLVRVAERLLEDVPSAARAVQLPDVDRMPLDAMHWTPVPDDVVHQVPSGDSGFMPCCGRTPVEAVFDQVTIDPDLVTCPGTVSL